MEDSKPRILYISSADPLKGPGAIGWEHYKQFKDAGYEIDMLTLYPVDDYPEILYVKKKHLLLEKLKNKYQCLTKTGLPGSPYHFFYKKDIQPPIPIDRVLRRVTKSYDLLIIYFWQGLLSFQTLDALYEKVGYPVVFFFSPDYSHMTGGCHFPGGCERYQTGCGCCPALHSNDENDFTHWNVLYRKKIYEKIQPVVFGNTYLQSFYKKSYLLRDARIVKRIPVVNTELFHPIDKMKLRKKYGITEKINFIIAFGCQHVTDVRKGVSYLIEALNLFSKTLSELQRNEVLLLVAGNNYETIQSRLPFNSKGMGMLPITQLSEFYSLADIFVCPSVNDAGPSMVGQSIACGTPVVGFEMGALLDWVKNHDTGYCAKLRDSRDLAEGIQVYYGMSKIQRQEKSTLCRNFVMQNSYQNRLKRWMELYHVYKDAQ